MTNLACLLVFSLALNLTLFTETSHAEHPYVGSGGCGCHRLELSDWKRSKHGKAFGLLKAGVKKGAKKKARLDPNKDYSRDEKCVRCHVVGYKKEGGFRDIESTKPLSGVGCEMCHGAGSDYRIMHKTKPLDFTKDEVIERGQLYATIDETVCTRCHGHKDTPFKPEVDKKYAIDIAKELKNERLFHRLYPVKGDHPLKNKKIRLKL